MAFHDVLLPTNVDYGTAGGPAFDVAITRLDSGSEERNIRWASELAEYDASYGIKSLDDLSLIGRFWRARHGMGYGFRWKDFHDFTSAANGRDDPTATDQVLGTGDGVQTVFQMVKRYGDAAVATPYVRTITKPAHGSIRIGDGGSAIVFDTVLVAADAVPLTEGVDYTVDNTSGEITFTPAPALGVALTDGFEYHVPVRFDIGKGALMATIEAFDSARTTSGAIPLVELRPDDVIVQEDYYYGDNQDILDLVADVTLTTFKRSVRVQQANGGKLLLPDPTTTTGKRIQPGVGHWYIYNHDITTSFEVRDHLNNLVATVPTRDGRTINLASNFSDTTVKRYYLTKTDDSVVLPSPYNGSSDENYLLAEATEAGDTYSRTLGAGSSADVTFLTPPGLPGISTWADTGHTFVMDVVSVTGQGIATATAAIAQVSADGLTIKQIGTASPSNPPTGAGQVTFAIPATSWTSVLATDRFVLVVTWQAAFGGSSTALTFNTGVSTSYLDTSVLEPPRLLQWLGF